jgi:glycosyl hydrolase family 48/cellulose binding protein with CBM2 domain/Big-like domain-containing protein
MKQSRLVAMTAAGALMTAGAVSVTASAAQAAVACSAAYTIDSSWDGGFQGSVRITNVGDAIKNWTANWSYTDGQKVGKAWNGRLTQTGSAVSVKDAGYNGALAGGAAVSFGFVGTAKDKNAVPAGISVNGVRCGGASGNGTNSMPKVALKAPTAGATFTGNASVPLTVSTADADGKIAKVEYYSADSTLIGSSTKSPFTASWKGAPAGSHSITARVYDNQGATVTSTPAGITVLKGAAVKTTAKVTTVPEGKTLSYKVSLSQAPKANVTLQTTRAAGSSKLVVKSGGSLTFTPSNWSTPQAVTVTAAAGKSGEAAVFSTTGAGFSTGAVKVTAVAAPANEYDERFLTMYNKLHDPANGYFSPLGVPYHSIETLIVEAPDQGHEATSEGLSYWMWLEATYGRISGDWAGYNNSWAITEKYLIPSHADQPTNSGYKASDPATYAPESDDQTDYPVKLDDNIAVGADPIAAELKSAYGTDDVYGMHWLIDVDNVYGFGRCGDGTTKPAYINTFQRGSSESTWETIPQPSCDTFAHGGKNGFLDLFTGDSAYAKQWKYTDAPDADARAVQAAYWADKWATAQGKQSSVSASVQKAAKMGDYLRYSMYDKYFKKIGGCTSPSCPAGSGKNSAHYLISWYYAWGGSLDTAGPWAWRIGDGAAHQGYQNPLAAYALSQVSTLKPKSSTGAADWGTSLTRQLEFYQWLQSSEGAIAGGATNSWNGAYEAPPSGSSTFYGMAYDEQPVWHDPPSNRWFGFQAWSLERVAEYYYTTGNAKAKTILDKWVKWALANSSVDAGGNYQIPSDLTWSGKPDTWNAASPGTNAGLHVTVANKTNDIGVAGSYAKVLTYYAAKSGDTASRDFAKKLIDGIWANNQDDQGVSVTEQRTDYSRFADEVYVPSGWSGTMPNGDPIEPGSTFSSIRTWYEDDPDWGKVQAYLDGGEAPSFNYHRFWAQADVATAMAVYGELFP